MRREETVSILRADDHRVVTAEVLVPDGQAADDDDLVPAIIGNGICDFPEDLGRGNRPQAIARMRHYTLPCVDRKAAKADAC